MSETTHSVTDKRNESSWWTGARSVTWRRVGIYVFVFLAIFLTGFVPMWRRANLRAEQRDAAQHELRFSRAQNALATAAIEARRGNYEPARQATSEFFTDLRSQTDGGETSSLTQAQRDNLRTLLLQRDEIITLLARGDAASSDRLSDIYVEYRNILKSVQPQSGNK